MFSEYRNMYDLYLKGNSSRCTNNFKTVAFWMDWIYIYIGTYLVCIISINSMKMYVQYKIMCTFNIYVVFYIFPQDNCVICRASLILAYGIVVK